MIFENNTIYHGKPSEENIGEIGCYETYDKLHMNFDHTQHILSGHQVTMLVHLAGVGHFELLNYKWDCESYASQFGPCDNITIDYEYALNSHIAGYTLLFCEYYKIPMELAPSLFARAKSRWDTVLELKRHYANLVEEDVAADV